MYLQRVCVVLVNPVQPLFWAALYLAKKTSFDVNSNLPIPIWLFPARDRTTFNCDAAAAALAKAKQCRAAGVSPGREAKSYLMPLKRLPAVAASDKRVAKYMPVLKELANVVGFCLMPVEVTAHNVLLDERRRAEKSTTVYLDLVCTKQFLVREPLSFTKFLEVRDQCDARG